MKCDRSEHYSTPWAWAQATKHGLMWAVEATYVPGNGWGYDQLLAVYDSRAAAYKYIAGRGSHAPTDTERARAEDLDLVFWHLDATPEELRAAAPRLTAAGCLPAARLALAEAARSF